MRVLVTGGAGFIGSHLVDALIEQNNEVYVIDDLSTGRASNINNSAKFFQVNITNEALNQVFSRVKPEIVFHFAAQTSVPKSIVKPIQDATININGSINVFQNAALIGVKHIIFASTAAVYGKPVYLPIDEDHVIKPLSPYGLSKAMAEEYLKLVCSQYGCGYSILRFANVYGDRQDTTGEGGVISIFIDFARKLFPPTIYGNGLQTRDFIYVRDIVSACIAAMDPGINKIFNVGTGEGTTILDLWTQISKVTNYSAQCVHKDDRPGDIKHSVMNMNKAGTMLKWHPEYSLEQGLVEMWKSLSLPTGRTLGLTSYH